MAVFIAIILLLILGIIIWIYAATPKLPTEIENIIDTVVDGDLPEIITGESGYAMSGDIKIWYEYKVPEDTPKGTVLLIMSMAGNALDWPPAIVQDLLKAGYAVIRHDNRGTGMSDWMESWTRDTAYSIADMADDTIAVLDALNMQNVHIIGLSFGGMIAQEVAIKAPERVLSLTLIMTSGFVGDPEVPHLTSRYFISSLVQGLPLLRYRIAGGEKNMLRERFAKMRRFIDYEQLDIKAIAENALYDLRNRRGINLKAVFQHQQAVTISGSRYEGLKALHTPTLVIHGTDDQLMPIEHGKKLVDMMPNAEGLWLDNVGHIFPLPDMDRIMAKIVSHLDEVREKQI